MRNYVAAIKDRLNVGRFGAREFLWIEPRDRATGQRVGVGLWSGRGDIDADILDRVTGETVTRTFHGVGNIVDVGAPVSRVGFEVQTLNLRLSLGSDLVREIEQSRDVARAPVLLARGYVHPISGALLGPLDVRFRGQVDGAPIDVPAAGGSAPWSLTLASYTQDLKRSSPAARSDADQRLRDPNDAFYSLAAVMPRVSIHWGGAKYTYAPPEG
ncbi:MAG: hypothetical protein CMM86_09290 [Rhodovulum sp.]|nr:hypothetical protein [Rhodovulum sp.]|tara:strand:- start:232 stop:873 length:642 start_codon:yes stop_codon:yes gene_type:complete